MVAVSRATSIRKEPRRVTARKPTACYPHPVKLQPTRALSVAALASLMLIAAACGRVAQPEGWSSPSINGDQILYFPKKDLLAAAQLNDTTSATVQWTFPDDSLPTEEAIDIAAVYGDVLSIGGTLYFAGWEGEIYAVDANTGRLTWTTLDRLDMTGSIVAGLASDGERLFAATTEGRVYAFNLEDGAIAAGWDEDGLILPKAIWATPIVRGDTLIVATMNGEVHAVSTADGSATWPEPFKASTGAIPEIALLDDSLLFVPTVGKAVYLLDPETGKEAHPSIRTDDWVWTRPALDGETVYFGDFAGTLLAIDITTGEEEWHASTGHKIKAAPAIVGDVVVVADRGSAVSFFDKTTGEQRGNRIPLPDAGTIRANVVAHDGIAYILTTKGKLFRAEPERLAVVEVPVVGVP